MPEWTENEDRILKENYPRAAWGELELLLNGHTRDAISRRAFQMNLKRNLEHCWLQEEISTLEELYPTEEKSRIMEKLPRHSWTSIQIRAGKLGIRRERYLTRVKIENGRDSNSNNK